MVCVVVSTVSEVKCDFFVWCDMRLDTEPDYRGTESQRHIWAARNGMEGYGGGGTKGSKGGSSGTMVSIVILRERKNETNMQKRGA